MSPEQTGAPTDLVGGMPATEGSAPAATEPAATETTTG